MTSRPRVIVCGTKFGRVYLSAFRLPGFPFELAGILAQGSARSQACAQYYRVPLFTAPGQLPADIDIACVVVGAAVNGGRGAELAQSLMARGIHVLQEHPLHPDELAQCLRAAHRNKVVYRLNTHYVHLDPVLRFISLAQALLRKQRLLFIDAAAAFQTAYTLFDILGEAIGGLRPWGFAQSPQMSADVRKLTDLEISFRSLDGVIAGAPCTLRIQNQMDPRDPDNNCHFFHRITLGTRSGNLTLLNTYGPVVWSPAPHMPNDSRKTVAMEDSADVRLDFPTATVIGPAETPNYRAVLSHIWPRGIAHAVSGLHQAAAAQEDSRKQGQYYLTLSRIWQDMTSVLGPVSLIHGETPPILSVDELIAGTSVQHGSTFLTPV